MQDRPKNFLMFLTIVYIYLSRSNLIKSPPS